MPATPNEHAADALAQILSYREEMLNARMPATPNGHAALRALAQILSYREEMLNAFFYFSANEYL